MHRLTASILDVSNAFKNTNVPIHERVRFSPPIYYLDWFERSYPNVTLNRDDGLFSPQLMNGIQGAKPAGRQLNKLLDAGITILKYKKITIDHAIYIKVFSDGTVSFLTVSTDDVINTTTKEISLGGTQLPSACMVVYFRVLHFGCIFFLFHRLLLNACVYNRKRAFWGPYL